MARGFGCLIAIATGILGLFFWPLWILTIAGVLLFALAGRRK